MHQVQKKYQVLQELCSGEDCTLKGSLQDETVFLKIMKKVESKKKCFQSNIDYANNAELEKLFDKGEDLLSYLKQKDNFQFDQTTGTLTLLGKHPTKKSEKVELHKILLQEKNASSDNPLQSIISSCCQQQSLDQGFVKWALKQISEKIEAFNTKINSQDEKDRIVRKIQVMGNQIENLKMKMADIFAKQELGQQKIYQIIKLNDDKYNTEIQQLSHQNLDLKQFINEGLIRNQNKIIKLYEGLEQQNLVVEGLKAKLFQIPIEVRPELKQSKLKILKIEQLQNKVNQQKEVLTKLQRTAKYFKHFLVRGINITKQDDFIFPTMLIGTPFTDRHQFTVRIKKMGILKKIYPGICIGIVDSKHKNKQSCENGDNVIQFGCGGKLFERNLFLRTQAAGFETGDVIQVELDIEHSKISWIVNGSERCNYRSELIKDPKIDWRPYIFMRDKGDSIDWILH